MNHFYNFWKKNFYFRSNYLRPFLSIFIKNSIMVSNHIEMLILYDFLIILSIISELLKLLKLFELTS